jgi:hypothetical protein
MSCYVTFTNPLISFWVLTKLVLDPTTVSKVGCVLPAMFAALMALVPDGSGVLPLPVPEVVPPDSPVVPDKQYQ